MNITEIKDGHHGIIIRIHLQRWYHRVLSNIRIGKLKGLAHISIVLRSSLPLVVGIVEACLLLVHADGGLGLRVSD